MSISRRQFFKKFGLGAAGVVAGGFLLNASIKNQLRRVEVKQTVSINYRYGNSTAAVESESIIAFREDIWKEIPFKDIKKGMRVRMFEPTGEAVKMTRDGKYEAITKTDAYKNKDGILTFLV